MSCPSDPPARWSPRTTTVSLNVAAGERIEIVYGADIGVLPAASGAPANLLELFVVDSSLVSTDPTVPVAKYASNNASGAVSKCGSRPSARCDDDEGTPCRLGQQRACRRPGPHHTLRAHVPLALQPATRSSPGR